jgi:hypothetical protein
MSAATGLDGLLEPLSRCLDAESARRVVELQVATPVQERIDMLAERANDGTLFDTEPAPSLTSERREMSTICPRPVTRASCKSELIG